MKPEARKSLRAIAAAAVKAETQTGCPALVTVCQCWLESGGMMRFRENNPFGIKARRGQPSILLETSEYFTPEEAAAFLSRGEGREIMVESPAAGAEGRHYCRVKDRFASYPSLDAAFLAHGRLLMTGSPYRAAALEYGKDSDVDLFMRRISGVYATAPGYYGRLAAVARMPEVRSAIAEQRAQPAPQG